MERRLNEFAPPRAILIAATLAMALVVLAVSLWPRGDTDSGRIEAPRPEVVADLDPADPLQPSSLTVPVEVSIATLLAEVESHVPTSFGSPEAPIELPEQGRTHARISLARAPFEAALNGPIARMAATVEYSLEATYDLPLLPDVNLGCGTDGGPRPRLTAVLEAPITLTSEWGIATEARVAEVSAASSDARDKCEVTFAGFDITGRMEAEARSFLEGHTGAIDSIVAAVDLRPTFEGWWKILAEPIELEDQLWLELRPISIVRGPITGEGDVVRVDANLQAVPRIFLGDRPPDWARPLPDLGTDDVEGALDILIEGAAEYDVGSEILTAALSGSSVEAAGQRLELERIEVSGIGGGRMALEVQVTGDLAGRLFLVGTPSFDPASGEVSVPDLDFSVATSSLLVSGASRALHRQLVTFLRNQARWPVADAMSWVAEKLGEGLNRELAEGVRLDGRVYDVGIIGVEARTERLVVQAKGSAEANFSVDRGG
jgi:hypothetical protein